jgi:hypothetical protein
LTGRGPTCCSGPCCSCSPTSWCSRRGSDGGGPAARSSRPFITPRPKRSNCNQVPQWQRGHGKTRLRRKLTDS